MKHSRRSNANTKTLFSIIGIIIFLIIMVCVFDVSFAPNEVKITEDSAETTKTSIRFLTRGIETIDGDIEFETIDTPETEDTAVVVETATTEIETEPIVTEPVEVAEESIIYEETTTYYEETEAPIDTEPVVDNVASDGVYIDYNTVLNSVYSPNNLYGFTEYEATLLAKIVEAEAGADYLCLEQKLLTACVVINLMQSDVLPESTIEGVLYHPGAYYPVIAGYFWSVVPSQLSTGVANYILNNGIICPPNVCYAANFPQGSGTYRRFYVPEQAHDYPYSYFCYD